MSGDSAIKESPDCIAAENLTPAESPSSQEASPVKLSGEVDADESSTNDEGNLNSSESNKTLDGEDIEAEMAAFYSELNEVSNKTTVLGKMKLAKINGQKVLPVGNAMDMVDKLTSGIFMSPNEVLLVAPDASEEELKKQFKKISLLIHPDKCKHEKANEAFDIVAKAYEELQKPEYRERYKRVIKEAKKRVIKERQAENKKRCLRDNDLLPTDDDSIREDVMKMCEVLVREVKERSEYANATRLKNEQYLWEEMMKEDEVAKEKTKIRKNWEDTREDRVDEWRDYREVVTTKKVKIDAFKRHTHKRESRPDYAVKDHSRPMGVDISYKQEWR